MENLNNLTWSIKDRLPHDIRFKLGKLHKLILYSGVYVKERLASNRNYFCPVCQTHLKGFISGGKLCPFCVSFPRHRALVPEIRSLVAARNDKTKILHVAPEYCLATFLTNLGGVEYNALDKFTEGHHYHANTVFGDLTCLTMESNQFDLIICLHVMEHIDDDAAAFSELYRFAKPGGKLLLAFPFRCGEPTYEDKNIVNPKDRERAFGQWDHVRFYGEDVVDRIAQAGFDACKVTSREIWETYSGHSMELSGIEPNEVFFICEKK